MILLFRDGNHAWNPTSKEIRSWAYSKEGIPEQDWELAVNSFDHIPMICTFIDDETCNRDRFFLSSLYVFTGDVIRGAKVEEVQKLSILLNKVDKTAKAKKLKVWIQRSKHLIQYPEEYSRDYWGLGSKYIKMKFLC